MPQKKKDNQKGIEPDLDPVEKEEEACEPDSEANSEDLSGETEQLAASAGESDSDSLRELMASNFVEYASYVIKERAIPDVFDGLKPVQRRILWSLHILDDGRFHKVANVIGHTMQYHPHGDASIGSALVVLANKEYFIDKQGNFGNILTGDAASAARYIECRLSPLAREVLFNDEITRFIDAYDGRKKEPQSVPSKVPSLLMMGSDGIAVGMTTRVLPHNFCELLKAQIAILKNQSFKLYPDFLAGGLMDVSDYQDGNGRVKLRARIEEVNDKTLVIREVPPTVTTETLMSSIEDAVRKGKIKVAEINDYTGEQVEIEISLPRGVYAKNTKKQLYAYTNCEISLSATLIVIHENRPVQMSVSEVLHLNTQKLVADLKKELEIELGKLHDRFHEKTLAQIFIENRIYKRIEECDTYEAVLREVKKGLEKFRDQLRRDITDEDIEKLLQLQIRRISKFDINKNRQEIDNILKNIDETEYSLNHLTEHTINFIQALLKKYGEHYPRRTEIEDLERIDVKQVALQNVRVGHDRSHHFVGTEVKNSNRSDDPLVCTEFDRLVLLRSDGTFKVIPIPEKEYVGPVKYLLKADKEQIYCMIYRDRKTNKYYAKRFQVDSYIMDKEYKSMPKNCIIENLYTNYGVVVRCEYKPNKRLKDQYVDVDFEDIPLRSRGARGFKIADHPVASFVQLRRGSAAPPETENEEEQHFETSTRESSTESQQEDMQAETKLTVEYEEGADAENKDDIVSADGDIEVDMVENPDASSLKQAPKKAASSRKKGSTKKSSSKKKPSRSNEKKKSAQVDKKDSKNKKIEPKEPASATPTSVADEWEKRTVSAQPEKENDGVEVTEASSQPADTDPDDAKDQDKPQAGKENLRSLRKLIDEETPFFLE